MSEGSETTDLVRRHEESANSGRDTSKEGNLIVCAWNKVIQAQLYSVDPETNSQVGMVKAWQKLFQSHQTFDTFAREIDGSQTFPVRLKGFHISDKVNKPVR